MEFLKNDVLIGAYDGEEDEFKNIVSVLAKKLTQ